MGRRLVRLEPGDLKALEGEEVGDREPSGHAESYCHQGDSDYGALGKFEQKSEMTQLGFSGCRAEMVWGWGQVGL